MKNRKLLKLILGLQAVYLLTLCAKSFAYAQLQSQVLYPNSGIGKAKLSMKDKKALKLIGLRPSSKGIDKRYEGQVVYFYTFGKKDINHNFPLEIYSDGKRKVFMFVVNSPKIQTPAGIKVGSSESSLVKAYGKKLKKRKQGGIYIKYSLGGRQGTDFYVKEGRITQIVVRRY